MLELWRMWSISSLPSMLGPLGVVAPDRVLFSDQLELNAAGIVRHVNAHKTEYMCFNQTGDISTLNGSSLKLVDKFTYLGNSVSSTETNINTRLAKAWIAIDRLSIGHMEVRLDR